MPAEPKHSASVSDPTPLGRAAWVALSIPLLGMIGVFVAIGWRNGPWLPLGIALATALVLVLAMWWTRKGRRLLETDPAEGRRVLNAQSARVGSAMARIVSVWLACTAIFIIVLLTSRL